MFGLVLESTFVRASTIRDVEATRDRGAFGSKSAHALRPALRRSKRRARRACSESVVFVRRRAFDANEKLGT
jgi:hypothetical protein